MDDRGLWYRTAGWIARNLGLRPLGGITITGKENVPTSGAVLIAPVHVSHLDPPLLGSCCPRELRFMAKEELFKNKLFGALIKSLGAYPVKRGESDTAAIKTTLQWLTEGRAVLVFPEGQRGDGKTLGVLLPGIAVLAKRSGALVVPVGINGTNVIMPKGRKGLKRHRITLFFGKPFTYADVAGADDKLGRAVFLAVLENRLVEACQTAGLAIRTGASQPDQTTSPPSETPS